MAQFPAPTEGIAITHFIVSRDVERSRSFYVEVLGGEAVLEGELSIVALANLWNWFRPPTRTFCVAVARRGCTPCGAPA